MYYPGSLLRQQIPDNPELFIYTNRHGAKVDFNVCTLNGSIVICTVDDDVYGPMPSTLDFEFEVVHKDILTVVAMLIGKTVPRSSQTGLRLLPFDTFKLLKRMLCKDHPQRNWDHSNNDIYGAYHLREKGKWSLVDSKLKELLVFDIP